MLKDYPGPLGIYLSIILRFGMDLEYKGPRDVLILSKNLTSAIEAPSIIDNKLEEDIGLRRVISMPNPTALFILSPLGLVPKHNEDFCRIHHLSHPKGCSVNDHILDGAGELRYIRFQEVLDLILKAGRPFIVIKRDIKDAFQNVLIAPQHQWLLGFMWRNKFYKEICLSFSLAITPFSFNLFSKGLH